MLRKWIIGDPSATWGKLIDAVDMIHSVPVAVASATEGIYALLHRSCKELYRMCLFLEHVHLIKTHDSVSCGQVEPAQQTSCIYIGTMKKAVFQV